MTPARAKECGYNEQPDGSLHKVLYTVYIGGKSEHRTHWTGYTPDGIYEQAEAVQHARQAKARLSTSGKKVRVLKETTTVEEVFVAK